jgi:aryl-alcohol dehydrogenase-like predicted oxidoreductase
MENQQTTGGRFPSLGVGVCNFSAKQIDEAAEALESHGLALGAAMTGYNVVRRYPEDNGVFDARKRHGVALIPYAPLAEGVLTGKYRNKRMPLGYSTACYFGHLNLTKEQVCAEPLAKRLLTKPSECDRKRMEPILAQMEAIGRAHEKSLAQVAINWLLTTPGIDVLPIPGIRTVKQATDNIGAVEWRMPAEERQLICAAEEQGRSPSFSATRRA